MNDLAPRQYYADVQLSAGARFLRGFRRLGLVFGTLAFGTGIVISIVAANQERLTTIDRHAQAVCFLDAQHRGRITMNQYRTAEVDLAGSGCPGPMYSETVSSVLDFASKSPAPLEGFIGPLYIGSLISLAAGISIFAIFWLIGWLCAGFTRD